MNLAKMRKTGFLEKARENVRKHEYRWYDQDAIAAVGKPYVLPETYSYMFEYENLTYDPAIFHFTNKLNPKIYDESKGRDYFFKRYPFLEYVKKGVEMIESSNFNCGYTVETEPPLVKPHIKKKDNKNNEEDIFNESES